MEFMGERKFKVAVVRSKSSFFALIAFMSIIMDILCLSKCRAVIFKINKAFSLDTYFWPFNILYKVLKQRTKGLWKLEWGCELIDLEKDFYVSRFYSKSDYN